MVIILVGVLTAVAVPKFLDFRTEGKVAALRQNLSMLRVAVKNQTQQALLRCGISDIKNWVSDRNTDFYTELFGGLYFNNITVTGQGANRICSSAQIPNPEDRKFFNVSAFEKAHDYAAGVDRFITNLPANPFIPLTVPDIHPMGSYSDAYIQSLGGKCGFTSVYPASATSGTAFHWLMNTTTGEVSPGSNTPGINECNF